MNCPFCKSELTDFDDKTWTHVANFFLKLTNPVSFVKNMSIGLYNVGKTIYYDFSDIPQTDEYLYCPICKVYFIECSHCSHLNCIGGDIMVSPKKITCNKCGKDYVYATHPSPEDHEFCG